MEPTGRAMKITVTGAPGTGKTRLLYMIKKIFVFDYEFMEDETDPHSLILVKKEEVR